jgi:hypothetical protein
MSEETSQAEAGGKDLWADCYGSGGLRSSVCFGQVRDF